MTNIWLLLLPLLKGTCAHVNTHIGILLYAARIVFCRQYKEKLKQQTSRTFRYKFHKHLSHRLQSGYGMCEGISITSPSAPSLHPFLHPSSLPPSIHLILWWSLTCDLMLCLSSAVFQLKSRECSWREVSHLLYGQHPSVHPLGLALLVFVLPLPAS